MALLDISAVSARLRTRAVGRKILAAETMASTNQTLLDAVASGEAQPGLVAVCETQTAGRGRQRRLWHSPAGLNLYMSVLWASALPPGRLPQLAMLAALALRDALDECAPEVEIGLKWPNDLWDANGRKLSGILCECPPWTGHEVKNTRQAVIGVGLNVNSDEVDFPPELRGVAGSLRLAAGGRIFLREAVMATFLNCLEPLLDEWEGSADFTHFIGVWNRYDILAGREVLVEMPGGISLRGMARGITQEGLLRVTAADGADVTVSAGDVHLRLQ